MPGNLVDLTPEVRSHWPTPNYTDPYERVWVSPLIGALWGLASATVALRLWARYMKHGGGLGLDDAFMVATWIFCTGFTACGIIGIEVYHSNRHMWDIPPSLWSPLAMLTGIAEVLYLLTGCSVRISVLLFYRRLMEDACSRRWRYAIMGAIAFTVSWVTACCCAIVFSCAPINAYWRAYDPNYTEKYSCVNIAAINYLVGTLSIAADLYAIALPCIMTWNFTMPLSQKIALNIVFGLGLFVVAACGVRNYYLFQLAKDSDFSWILTEVNILSQLELQLATICASAPALRMLYRVYLKAHMSKMLHSTSSTSGAGTGTEASIMHETYHPDKEYWGDFQSALAGKWSTREATFMGHDAAVAVALPKPCSVTVGEQQVFEAWEHWEHDVPAHMLSMIDDQLCILPRPSPVLAETPLCGDDGSMSSPECAQCTAFSTLRRRSSCSV